MLFGFPRFKILIKLQIIGSEIGFFVSPVNKYWDFWIIVEQ